MEFPEKMVLFKENDFEKGTIILYYYTIIFYYQQFHLRVLGRPIWLGNNLCVEDEPLMKEAKSAMLNSRLFT